MSKDATYRKLINTKRWRTIRNQYLTEHPQCEECLAQHRHIAANCVHHIVPVESAPTDVIAAELCYSVGNLRALCTRCHSEHHKAERSHSKEAHRQRTEDALNRWKQNNPPPTSSAL